MSFPSEDRYVPLAEFPVPKQVAIILGYFAHFHHPLQSWEISRMLALPEGEVLDALRDLRCANQAFCCEAFWSSDSNLSNWVAERLADEKRAEAVRTRLPRLAQRVARFPFVEAVAISGSLSKGRLKQNGDVDFFVVTTPGRLWICRSLLILYKKLVLFNSRKWFCLNYLIDLEHLNIPDQNLFTAVEINTLMPMWERGGVWSSFYDANQWHAKWLKGSNRNESGLLISKQEKRGPVEHLLSVPFFDGLERFLHRMTLRRWQRKFAHHRDQDFEQMFRSTQGVSKHHPQNNQSKALDSIQRLFYTQSEL